MSAVRHVTRGVISSQVLTSHGQREKCAGTRTQPGQKYHVAPILFHPATISTHLSYTKI